MPLLQNEEVETLRARVRELESLLGQRCDGIDCDRGEECVELQKQLNELRGELEIELRNGPTAAEWARTVRELDEAREDLADMRRDRDNMKAWAAAMFAHVCRLAGKDPRDAPQEIKAIANSVLRERERRVAEAQRNKTTAYIGARIGATCAPGVVQLGGTSPLVDLDAPGGGE